MSSLSEELASFVVETGFEDLPEAVVHEAKRILLDSVGCAFAGMATEKGEIAVKFAGRLGGPAESSIIGTRDKVSCYNAAFANAELINSLDYDSLLFPPGHVSPCVVAPPLAMAESIGASGKDLILAIVLGHEITVRISRSLPGMTEPARPGIENSGVRYSQVYGIINQGVFGGAAAAGKVLKLDHGKMTSALGIAGYLCSGPTFIKWAETVPSAMTKQGSAGWAAAGGVTAALLAEMGYFGDTTIFDGEYGFWRFFAARNWEPDKALEKLGEEWFILQTRYKMYPCGGVMDGALDCFIDIIDKNDLTPTDIDSVKVFCQPLVEKPVFRMNELKSTIDTQFNLPYLIAVVAHRVQTKDWHTLDTMRDPKILEFMKKVSYKSDPESGGARDGRRISAAAEVVARGRTFREERSASNATVKDSEVIDEQLVEKFKSNAPAILTPSRITKAVQSLFELERLKNVTELTRQFIF